MAVKCVLVAGRDQRLVSRLDDRLRSTCVVLNARTSGEALSKLQSEWSPAALVDGSLTHVLAQSAAQLAQHQVGSFSRTAGDIADAFAAICHPLRFQKPADSGFLKL